MSSDNQFDDSFFDQIESQVALVAEGILKTLDQESSRSVQQENCLLKEIEKSFDDLKKLTSVNSVTLKKAIAENVSNMDDFLRLMLRLMQDMLTKIIVSETAEMPLQLLKQCHSFFVSWTNGSRLFSERLLIVCDGFIQHLSTNLQAFHAMWMPTGSLVSLAKSALMILGNLALEEKCHETLIQRNIPQLIIPLCFSSEIRIRWESKSFLALLESLAGPWYHSFLRLSLKEINLLRFCFETASQSNDHHVRVQIGAAKSFIRYSAFELAQAIAYLVNHKMNRAAFADPETMAASYNLLETGSSEEKSISIQLISKLIEEPEMHLVFLDNHPDVLEFLQSLSESNEAGSSLNLSASTLLKTLLDKVSDVISEDVQELETFAMKADQMLWMKKELERLLACATQEMSKSKVLLLSASDDTVEVSLVKCLIFITSHLCILSQFKEHHLFIQFAVQGCPQFLSVLQDYTQRHFSKVIENPDDHHSLHPLHPLSLALHCTLILLKCSSHVRNELGQNGGLWQLVKNLRSLQMIPGWTGQLFRTAELILLIITCCSLEPSCQQLIGEEDVVKILLSFCKSNYFGIRLGAKSCLSSVSCLVNKQQWRFLCMDKHEHAAVFECLKEFAELGSYKRELVTSLCKYYFSASDILLFLNTLIENPLNVEVILATDHDKDICSVISQFLTNGTDLEKDAVAELLWKLCRSRNVRSCVLDRLPNEVQKQLPAEAFGSEEKLQFSCGPSVQRLETANAGNNITSVKKYGNVKKELSELEDLLFETMDEIWRSRTPPALEGHSYLLKPLGIYNMFAHLDNFFRAIDKALCEEACQIIIEVPTFLSLIANVMKKQLQAKANKMDAKQDMLCIKAVFHCLQVWITYSEEMKDYLGHSGIISNVILLHLKLIQAFPGIDEDYIDIAEAVLSTLCQCTTRVGCCNYILDLNCEDILVSMSKSSLFQISFNSKTILSSLSRYLPQEYQTSFKLTTEEWADLLRSLDIVLEQGIPEGELFFSALELLQYFKNFIQCETNKKDLAFSAIYKPIACLLFSGEEAEKRAACELLWNLVTKRLSEDTIVIASRKESAAEPKAFEYLAEPAIQSLVFQSYPEILAVLSTLSQSEESENLLYFCAHLVLMKESSEIIGKDILKTLTFAEGCYMCSKYTECFKLASWVYQETQDKEMKRKALALKGKALYNVFVAEYRALKKKGSSKATKTSCYSKAQEAIHLLGLTVGNQPHDREAEKFLDNLHLDCIRKARNPSLACCLLCQKKRSLKASHVWPNSVLKHLLKCICPSEQQVLSVPWTSADSLRTSKQLTFRILCGDCEQLLSHSCENKFKVEFFSKLYDPEDVYTKLAKPQSIKYGEYLYRFCISIIFRALPLVKSDVSQLGNSDSVYELFTTCRELLLTKDLSKAQNKPSLALFLSPTSLPEGAPNIPMMERILHSTGMALFSDWSLDECTAYHGKASFLLTSLGVLNIIVNLDPQMPLLLPPTSMIDPKGGTITFPEDCKRFFAMPLGVWKILEEAASFYSRRVFYFSQDLLQSKDWAKREFIDLQLSVLEHSNLDENQHTTYLNCLPGDFGISDVFSLGKSLKLPVGHRVLLHLSHRSEHSIATIFLAARTDLYTDEPFTCSCLYIILALHVPGYIVCIGYGVSQSKGVVTSSLANKTDKPMLPSIEAKYKTKSTANELLSKLLQLKGFASIEALIFWFDRVRSPQLDKKCTDISVCWYCSGKCDNCMEITSFDRGPVVGYHTFEPCRFCDDECMKYYNNTRINSNIQVLLHEEAACKDSHKQFLSIFCGLLDTNMQRNKVSAHFFCNSEKSEVYVLLRIRSIQKQQYFAFVLSEDFSPATCLPKPMSFKDEDMFLITGLQIVMKAVLAKLDFPDFSACVRSLEQDSILSQFSDKSFEMPPLQISVNNLPNAFKLSAENRTIVYPSPYHIVLHRTGNSFAIYLLANSAAAVQPDTQFLVLLYYSSENCKAKIMYNVKDIFAPITVKNLDPSDPQCPLSSYDKLFMDRFTEVVCAKLTLMLQERGAEYLTAFLTSKSEISTSTSECPESCWLCYPSASHSTE